MNAIIRVFCQAAFFMFIMSAASADDEKGFSTQFLIERLEDGKICAEPRIVMQQKIPGFLPVIILRHQVVSMQNGRVEATEDMNEVILRLKEKQTSARHCFKPLRIGEYQLSRWFVLYAGKMYTLQFKGSRGSNEVLWNHSAEDIFYSAPLEKQSPRSKISI